jgi:hypothetical protein
MDEEKKPETVVYETQHANDYQPSIVECVPESVTLSTLNDENRKYWDQGNK